MPATALGVWAVVVPGLSGHAGDPGLGAPAVIVDAVHVAAAAIWIGGLAQLVWVMPHATRGLAGEQQSAARLAATRRFSTLALGSVIVVAATGGARALWEVSAVSQLWTTGYGRTLIVKTALLAGLIALGYRNRSALERFAEIRRRGVIELGLMAGLLAAVSVLTNLQPANAPSLASAASSPPPGGTQVVHDRAGRLVLAVWPGTAGPNWFATRIGVGSALPVVTVQPQQRRGFSIPIRRVGDVAAGIVPRLSPGTYTVSIVRGASTSGATIEIGPARRAPAPPPPPNRTGAVAAEEAGDLAVGMQRAGPGVAAVTLIGQSGSTVPDALVTFAGRTALPCGTAPGCYRVRVPASPVTAAAQVLRPSQPAVAARIALPAADAPSAGALVRKAAGAYRALSSVRSENVLASDPRHAVHTTFLSHAPNQLSIDVHGGERAIIIGGARYDRNAAGRWTRSQAVPARYPDPFWADGATAAHVAGRDGRMLELTLVVPGNPTFFRLWLDPRTDLVHRLRMITAAHFMSERELDFNRIPMLNPPPLS